MLIPAAVLKGIEAGSVTLAFRRWDRPRINTGTRLRTAVGLVEVVSVETVGLSRITAAQARQAGFSSRDELAAFLNRRSTGKIYRMGVRFAGADPRIALRNQPDVSEAELADLTARLAGWPWAIGFLNLIAQRPAVRAPDLAAILGWETAAFKRNVRQLKELGLTESLDVGYRISPRGQIVLDALGQCDDHDRA
jgi:hypothetical protein